MLGEVDIETTVVGDPTVAGDTVTEGRLRDVEPPPERVGRYVVLRQLGEGGMGVVYEAFDPDLDRKVAVKVLHGETRRGRPINAAPRLLREARALAQLSHPNVVAIFDVGLVGEHVFLAMEHVDGETLGRWQRGERGWAEVVAAYVEAGKGLAAAHDKRLVHRDFKPENVILDRDGRVRVLDFGLAIASDEDTDSIESSQITAASRLTLTGLVMGTPAYMAPEQLGGGNPDARSDQFSFCVSLFEGLFGQRPFSGSTLRELGTQMESGAIQQPTDRGDVPSWLLAVLVRGMSPDPEQRWPSMAALLAWLDPKRRRRWRRSLALSGLVGALGVSVLGVHAHAQTADEPCRVAGDKLRAAYDEDTRTTVYRAILATELAYSRDTAERVREGLDDYATRWISARQDACLASEEREPETLDLQMQCLDDRLDTFAALVEVLEHADADVVANAARGVDRLPSVARCADLDALSRTLAEPADEIAEEVETLRRELNTLAAHELTGRYASGLARAHDISERARELGYQPLLAEALFQEAMFQERLGSYPDATELMTEAAMIASSEGHIDLAAQAMTQLTGLTGYAMAHYDEGLQWGRHAEAAAARAHLDASRRAQLQNNLGAVAFRSGDYVSALEYYRAAREVLSVIETPRQEVELASTYNNLGSALTQLGRHEEARDNLETALKMFEDMRGPSHPETAIILGNLGNAHFEIGDIDQALEMHQRALLIRLAALPELHPYVASSYQNLGLTLKAHGQFEEAYLHLRRAVDLKRRAMGDDHPDVALAYNNLGEVQRAMGNPKAALESHTKAQQIWLAAQGPDHPFLGYPTSNLGLDHLELGNYPQARAYLEQALTIRKGHLEDPTLLALTRLGLARTFLATNTDLPQARIYAEQATQALKGTRYPTEAQLATEVLDQLSPPATTD